MNKIWAVLCFLLQGVLYAQQDSIFLLDTVVLENNTFEIQKNINSHSSNFLTQLEQQTPVFVKKYGTGNLATVSYQGTSSSQNALFWNNINLNPVNSGTLDYSLIDSYLFDYFSLSSNQNMNQGSAIGADLVLKNKLPVDSGLFISHLMAVGDFSNLKLGTKLNFVSKKNIFSCAFIANKAKNNFRFYNPISKQEEQRANNELQQIAGKISFYRWTNKGYWFVDSWNKLSERYIPTPVHVQNQHETQDDRFSRNVIGIAYSLKKGLEWKQNIGYLFESYKYQNPVAAIDGKGSFQRILTNGSLEKKWSKYYQSQLKLFADQTFALVSDNYRNRAMLGIAVFQKVNFAKEFSVQMTNRKEWYSESSLPFVADISMNWSPKKYVFYARINKNARIPTLNDLYWTHGGNPNLKSELAKTGYLGCEKKGVLGSKIEFFYGNINQMIIWLPNVNNGLWQPQNIQTVKRRGLNMEISYLLKIKSLELLSTSIYAFTSSVDDQKMQLIYTPKQQVKQNFQLKITPLSALNYTFQWTDKRFLSKDHATSLPNYTVSDLSFSQLIPIKDATKLLASLTIENLFGYTYYNLPFRPMPRRYVSFGLELSY